MSCNLYFQPTVYVRQSPLSDKWRPRNKTHLTTRLATAAVSATVADVGGDRVFTTSSAHNLISGDLITSTAYGNLTVTYLTPTTFQAGSYTSGSSDTYVWRFPYEQLDQVAIEGSELSVTLTGSEGLLTGLQAYQNDTINLVLPNLETPFTNWSTWKTTYDKCEKFDIILWDSNQNVAISLFDISAQLAVQANLTDLVRLILTGSYAGEFPNTWNKTYFFDAPLRMDGLLGFWNVQGGYYTTDTGIDELTNQTFFADMDAVNTVDSQQPLLRVTNGVQLALFDGSDDELQVPCDSTNEFAFSTMGSFYLFGIMQDDSGGSGTCGVTEYADVFSDTGVAIDLDQTASEVDFVLGAAAGYVTLSQAFTDGHVGFIAYYTAAGTARNLYVYDTSNGWVSTSGTVTSGQFGTGSVLYVGSSQLSGSFYGNIRCLGIGAGVLTPASTSFTDLQAYIKTIVDRLNA